MNEAESAPSPKRFCRKLGIRNAALNASAASVYRPKKYEKVLCRANPATRLNRMPVATRAADRPRDRRGSPKRRRREGGSVDIFLGRSLAEGSVGLLHQIGFDERVEIAVEHAADVADLLLRPMILHHLVRVQHVAADLAAEGDALLLAADLIELGLVVLHLQIVEAGLQHFHRRVLVAVLRSLVLARHDHAGGFDGIAG